MHSVHLPNCSALAKASEAKSSSDLAGAAIRATVTCILQLSLGWVGLGWPNWMLSTRPKPSSQKICPQAAFGGNHHTFYVIDSTFSRWEWTNVRREALGELLYKTNCLFRFLARFSWTYLHCEHGCNKRPAVWRSANKVLRLFLPQEAKPHLLFAFCIHA